MSRNKRKKGKKQTYTPKKQQSLPSTFKINLEMLSDWHIGSGAGISGNIDSLVKRDHNDMPYIPAKTVTGIWRDACELVAQGLDNNQEHGSWQQWVNYLFGDQPAIAENVVENKPIPAALSIRPAYLPELLSNVINSKEKIVAKQLKQAITFVKPGIKINSQSGVAEQDCLRLEEQVRMGAILSADCTLKLPAQQDQQQAAFALLIAGAKMVEHLGGNRRRGSGRCCLTLPEVTNDLNTWIEWIKAHPVPPNIPPNDDRQSENQANTLSYQSSQTWVCIPLKIILRSPLVISQRTVGNVVETLDYIPGTHLLRLVARKLSKKLNINLTDAITKGDLLVTNGTIEINGHPGKPVPFALFYEKLGEGFKKGGKIYNRLVQPEPPGEQLKGYRSGYISQIETNSFPKYTTVPLTLGTHNTIEDQYQRPTREVGGVYSYEAIKTGTIFQAELRLSEHLSTILTRKNSNWWQELNGRDRLGQSKKDDYGNIKIAVPKPPQEFERNIQNESKLYVWLVSDLLLRDERLRPTASIEVLEKELSDKLGVTVTLSKSDDELLTLIARQNRLESWQVKWGLPRPSLVGLGAGTCIIFDIDKPPDLNKLAEIEAKGIGERTAEGYGQICFNHPLLTKPFPETINETSENNNKPNNKNTIINENHIAFNYAHLIEISAWREEIQKQAIIITSQSKQREDIMGITESKPSMSQLGALRAVISRLQSFKDVAKVISWIDSVKSNSNRQEEKWPKDSLEKIKKLIEHPQAIWQKITINPELTLTEDGKQKLQEELWAETVRSLINACILAHKRDLEKTENQENNLK